MSISSSTAHIALLSQPTLTTVADPGGGTSLTAVITPYASLSLTWFTTGNVTIQVYQSSKLSPGTNFALTNTFIAVDGVAGVGTVTCSGLKAQIVITVSGAGSYKLDTLGSTLRAGGVTLDGVSTTGGALNVHLPSEADAFTSAFRIVAANGGLAPHTVASNESPGAATYYIQSLDFELTNGCPPFWFQLYAGSNAPNDATDDAVFTAYYIQGTGQRITRPLAIADGFHYTMSLDLFGTSAIDAGDCIVNLLYTSVAV
jgi:hypothetical protein